MQWDGVTQSSTLRERLVMLTGEVFAEIHHKNWQQALAKMAENYVKANQIELDNKSSNSIIHYAAFDGVSLAIMQELINKGASRMIKNAGDKTAYDIAKEKNHQHLYDILTPQLIYDVPSEKLKSIENQFHQLIRAKAGQLIEKHRLRLPQLGLLLEQDHPYVSFLIPEYYGGYKYRLVSNDNQVSLISQVSSRMSDGSAQIHIITPDETKLLAKQYDENYDSLFKQYFT